MSVNDDGLTPLLPRGDQREIVLPSRRLVATGLLLGCSALIDAAVCSYYSTGGFSSDWWRRLGLGSGPYPFGSAGLDLLVLSVLRPLLGVVGCLTFYSALKRANVSGGKLHEAERARRQGDDDVADGDLDNNGSSLPTVTNEGGHGNASHVWRDQGGKRGADARGEVDGEAGNGTFCSNSEDVLGPAYEIPRWTRWLEPLCPAACSLGLLVLLGKCLTRLVVGPGSEQDCGLRTGWFWASIGWSILASGAEFLIITGFTATCRQYWFLYCCRASGDFEAAEEQQRTGGEGGRSTKKNGGYTATFGDVIALCAEDWRLILMAFAALLLAAFSQVLIPHFTGDMIDNVVESGDNSKFRRSTVYLVLAALSCSVFSGIRGCIFSVVGARVNVRVRQRLFESLVSQEIGFFDTTKTGDLTSRLSSDCTKVGDQVTLNVNVFLRNLVMVLVTLLFMFYLSWRLSLVAFVSVPAIVIVSKWYGLYIRELSKLSQDKLAEAGSVAEESLGSMPTVRSFAAEGRESKEYANTLHEFYGLSKRSAYAYGFYACSFILLPNLVTAVVLFYGGTLVMQNQISGGKVVSFMIYLTSLSDGFNDMASIFSSMTQAVGAADKVFELIRREPKGATATSSSPDEAEEGGQAESMVTRPAVTQASPAAPGECRGEIELRGVDFEYPSRPGRRILDGISFNAAAGQVLALVGPSGGGKSSCIALLENLYQPSRGQVMLDGMAVHKYDHRWLHRNISIVGQEPTLYARSIRENIIYGLEDEAPSMADVEEAARLANAHVFISQMPEKYETQAGERGVQMSGGQKQRIAIARALVRKPRVLLLDEATSALDAESEHLVQLAIDNMIARGGMTVILIAHRLSTVKRADKIVVINGGKVAEEGTHEELLSVRAGVYSGLVKRQLDLRDKGDPEDLGESTPGPSTVANGGRKTLSKARKD